MSTIIGDVMFLHQALQQPDKEDFLKAMVKEISTHRKIKHWKVVHIKEVRENIKILDLVLGNEKKKEDRHQRNSRTRPG